MRYVRHISTKQTPQSAPIPGEDQVRNSAGGFVYAVDNWIRLRRFLILGSEGGTYYATEAKLTRKNAEAVVACIQEDGPRAVREIVEISNAGRAPKNDPAVFALALAMAHGDDETKRLVVELMPRVCRIGTHLFHFADAVNEMRGWGKMLRQAVSTWYGTKNTRDLALQTVKYKQRDGWSHKDLLRLAHVKPNDDEQNAIFNWVAKDNVAVDQFRDTDANLIWASDQAQRADKPELLDLIAKHGLPREALPTECLKDPDIWAAMLPSMGLTALIRNLANMTRCGLIEQGMSDAVRLIIDRLSDDDALAKARIHPIQMLSALVTYSSGTGARSRGAGWTPNQNVVDALDAGFYKCFRSVEPTGKRHLLALDVSGSMGGGLIAGVPGLSPRIASAAMAMVTLATEQDAQTVAFTRSGDGLYQSTNGSYYTVPNALVPMDLSKRRRLDDVVKSISGLPFGGTDCSLPMLYAMDRKIIVDAFVVYTDSETWAGNIHPSQALRQYRERFNPDAKLIVVGMVSNGFSIADPNDAGMLDIVGFDTASPSLMADFVRGQL